MKAVFKNGTYTGDILHCYSEKNDALITLENAVYNGRITTGVSSHPAGSPKCKEEYWKIGRVEITVCPRDTEFGVQVTLGEGAVWNVTGESYLSVLTIAEGAKVAAAMTVDGKEVAPAPGTYEGKIVLKAL